MAFQPMPLSRRPLPFDHPEWIFELNYDGFRSLAVIQNGRTQLISRNGHPFNSFSELSKSLAPHSAGKTVLDGEIVCLDKRGRPQFRDLLFHRGEPCFYAFDLLSSSACKPVVSSIRLWNSIRSGPPVSTTRRSFWFWKFVRVFGTSTATPGNDLIWKPRPDPRRGQTPQPDPHNRKVTERCEKCPT
jgi:hypothetical protein